MSPIPPLRLRHEALPLSPLVSRRSAAASASAVDRLAALRRRGQRHAVLLESCGRAAGEGPPPSLRQTILVTRPLLQITARRGELHIRLLDPGSAPLLDELAIRLEGSVASAQGLSLPLVSEPSEQGFDLDRLRSPSILDPLRVLAGLLADRHTQQPPLLPPGLFGALGHDLIDHFETLPARPADDLDEPDLHLVLAADYMVEDQQGGVQVITRGLPWEAERSLRSRHAEQLALLQVAPEACSGSDALTPPGEAAIAAADLDEAGFCEGVRRLRQAIGAGEVFQAVLSRRLRLEDTDLDPLQVYRQLRANNPSPYMFFVDTSEDEASPEVLLGASPETFLRAEAQLEIRPIAGTVPRGRDAAGDIDPDQDGRLALAMLLDPKEQAEHAMLVDLARNDLARVCDGQGVRVAQQFGIERYSHVQHMVSRVHARLDPGLDALDAYRAVANMGTLTGAPKLRAVELLRELEPSARGFYGGAVGYVLADGRMDTAICIRALRRKGGAWYARSGAGIVWDSDPGRELAETLHKARALRVALGPTTGEAAEVRR